MRLLEAKLSAHHLFFVFLTLSLYFPWLIQVTFAPKLPEEARGDQFETATPVRVEDDKEGGHEEQSATLFDYSAIEIHPEGISDADAYTTETHPDIIQNVFNDLDGVKTQEPGDETAMGTTTMTPYSLPVSSEATTLSHQDLLSTSQLSPVTDRVATYEDMEGSGSRGTDDEAEGSADEPASATTTAASPSGTVTDETEIEGTETPTFAPDTRTTAGSHSSAVTDETKIGRTERPPFAPGTMTPDEPALTTTTAGSRPSASADETKIRVTEPPSFVPSSTLPETTTRSQIDDLEGSASGDEEASGQDVYPPESPVFTSRRPPVYSSTKWPHPATEVTAAPVDLTDGDALSGRGSGADQLSGQGEFSGQQESVVDLPQEVTVTVLPDVAAVTLEDQTTLATDTEGISFESSTAVYSTRPSLAATDKIHTSLATKRAPTPPDHTSPTAEVYAPGAEQSAATSKPHVSQTSFSTTSPLYTFDRSAHSVPQRVLIPDPAASPLPDNNVDYDGEIAPPLLESMPQITDEIPATEDPESDSDSLFSLEASTVNIRGTRTTLLLICYHSGSSIAAVYFIGLPVTLTVGFLSSSTHI